MDLWTVPEAQFWRLAAIPSYACKGAVGAHTDTSTGMTQNMSFNK